MGLLTCYVRADGCASRMIEWFGAGGWSHVATLLPSDQRYVIDARSDVIDGIPSGVRRRPVEYLARWECLWVDVPATEKQLARVERLLRSQLGAPYDRRDIWAFATGRFKHRDWREDDAWICSELAIWAQEGAGIAPYLRTPVNRITPGGAYLVDAALGARPVASPPRASIPLARGGSAEVTQGVHRRGLGRTIYPANGARATHRLGALSRLATSSGVSR